MSTKPEPVLLGYVAACAEACEWCRQGDCERMMPSLESPWSHKVPSAEKSSEWVTFYDFVSCTAPTLEAWGQSQYEARLVTEADNKWLRGEFDSLAKKEVSLRSDLRREIHVRETAEQQNHYNANRAGELYVERDKLQAENQRLTERIEKLEKALRLASNFYDAVAHGDVNDTPPEWMRGQLHKALATDKAEGAK